jgi:hypothetical protein
VFGGLFQLSRFHLRRALNRTLDNNLVLEAYQACVRGEVDKANRLLMVVQQEVSGDEAKEVAQLRSYPMANAFGLRDYRLEVDGDGLRGLGAMESNIDKLIANRMKKRGMSWTIKGAQRMSRLIS